MSTTGVCKDLLLQLKKGNGYKLTPSSISFLSFACNYPKVLCEDGGYGVRFNDITDKCEYGEWKWEQVSVYYWTTVIPANIDLEVILRLITDMVNDPQVQHVLGPALTPRVMQLR